MKNIEKLMLFLVVLTVLSRFGALGSQIFYASNFGLDPTPMQKQTFELIYLLLLSLVNLGVGIWLYSVSKIENLNPFVWLIFGLFFGIYALILFYLIQIYSSLNEKAKLP